MSRLDLLKSEFERIHRAPPPLIVRAPGRVNLIGEHTDYNDGFVLPIAIDRDILIAARARADREAVFTALDVSGGQSDVFSLDRVEHHDDYRWANYIRGVAYFLQREGAEFPGLDAVITSEIPSGAGLSSSAALEVGTATTFQAFGNFAVDKVTLARLCQRAENEFVGVKSGIMDQFASALGEKGSAILIDCRALTHQTVPLPRGVTVVVADTMKKRHLAGSEYNTRRAECENAVVLLGNLLRKPLRALRDVSLKELHASEKYLPPNLAKRARHVLSENERVLKAVRAAKRGDAVTFGKLMNESQSSLRDDYEASSPELDTMVEIARSQAGCLGSRLTGAGWGGATVNLVRDEQLDAFVDNVRRAYGARTGIDAWVSPVRASAGASVLEGTLVRGGNAARPSAGAVQ